MNAPAQTEAYQAGDSSGWDSANYAVAYENAVRYADAPAPADYRGHDQSDQQRWDFVRGFEDGWARFMNEDYPQ